MKDSLAGKLSRNYVEDAGTARGLERRKSKTSGSNDSDVSFIFKTSLLTTAATPATEEETKTTAATPATEEGTKPAATTTAATTTTVTV
ncbi:hypothetical protein C7Y45_26900 [Brevibacillus brevis]|nr:hypothetical protein C7Y45_26900 [Lysinibacillus sp. SDF0063]